MGAVFSGSRVSRDVVELLPVLPVEVIRVDRGWLGQIEVCRQHSVAFHFAEVLVAGLEAGHVEALDLIEPFAGGLKMHEDGLVVRVGGVGKDHRVRERLGRNGQVRRDGCGRRQRALGVAAGGLCQPDPQR